MTFYFFTHSVIAIMSNKSASPTNENTPNQRHHQQRPTRSDFDKEPNPFEQSFSSRQDQSSNSPTPASKFIKPSSSPRPVLPPLAAIASPSDASSFTAWGNFGSSSLTNSLRAGPLSPAMLAGPQQPSENTNSHFTLDHPSFRTGLTPRTGFTPRSGLTPGASLTPLVGGPVSFPPPSPNTAAFLAMMNTNGGPSNPSQTITPNTLSAITGAFSNAANTQYQQNGNDTQNQNQNNDSGGYMASASSAASTAANGLFLLSQAHQELTKREEAKARAGNTSDNNSTNGTRRGIKRKSYDATVPSPTITTKRPRANTGSSSNGRRLSQSENGAEDDDEEVDEEDEDIEDEINVRNTSGNTGSGGRRGQKKPETEEEKRKNFLERNRQGTLFHFPSASFSAYLSSRS